MKKLLIPAVIFAAAFAALMACRPAKDKPEPPEAAVSVVVLYDAKALGEMAPYADPAVDAYCEKNGHQLRIHPITVVDEHGKTPSYLTPYVDAAKGKKLPVVFTGRGGKIKDSLEQPKDPQQIIAWIERKVGEGDPGNAIWAGGQWRKLGLKMAKPNLKGRWPVEGSTAAEPIIPEADWHDVNLATFSRWSTDQNGYNSCCPSSGNAALVVGACRAGLDPAKWNLSVADAYARINGGHDQGAMLEDFWEIATKGGVCTTDYFAEQGWRGGESSGRKEGYKESRLKHRALVVTICEDWPAVASALMRNKPVHYGLGVDSRFKPNGDGIIGRKIGRGGGGHAVLAVGLKKIDGEWYVLTQNSWSMSWGGSKSGEVPAGMALIHHSYIDFRYGAFAIGAVVSPSDDPIASAKPKAKTFKLHPVYANSL